MDCQISDAEYKEVLDWLFSQLPMFSRVGAPAYKPGLQTTESLDEIFGHPHRKFRSIHVAGTNGKGSTSHMLAAVLQSQGYKTGLYTSPHLTDFRERMRVNGEMIPKSDVIDFVTRWRNIDSDLRPSFFELTMMMAFDWFAREQVDIAVIEVGMGGRLDSTNIISPLLSVITNISFDHTQFLGSTLEAIAAEKAGIIKPDVPVVVGEASGKVRQVFEEKAKEDCSPLFFAQNSSLVSEFSPISGGWQCSSIHGDIAVPLGGEYQKSNIQTVLTALQLLPLVGVEVSDSSIKDGLENVCTLSGLRGRWQILRDKPVVVCDTGHNIDGLTETMKSLDTRYQGKTKRLVLGFVNDKDVAHIVDIFPHDAVFYFTSPSVPRAMKVEDVTRHFEAAGIKGTSYPTVCEAYAAALTDASENDVIYVGGSTFVVADFLSYIDSQDSTPH